jgi:hypothetical protein
MFKIAQQAIEYDDIARGRGSPLCQGQRSWTYLGVVKFIVGIKAEFAMPTQALLIPVIGEYHENRLTRRVFT